MSVDTVNVTNTAFDEAETQSDVALVASSRFSRIRRAFRHRSLLAGSVIVTMVVVLVLLAPVLTSYNPDTANTNALFQPPSLTHLFGTDSFGRDLLSRVLYGGRYTLGASALIVICGGTVGTILGLIAGFLGGVFGFAIMRLVDLLLAFPGILLALAVAAILGPGLFTGVFAVAIILVPAYARIVERTTVEVRHLPYVDAARTLGGGSFYLVLRHIIPNVRSGIIVLTSSWLGIAALWIAALGFLGLGTQPPTPEWGSILSDGQTYMTIAWWMTVFPGIFLALFVVGVNLIGDGLRDELDATLART